MDWRYNTIWFEQIDTEKKLTMDFKDCKSPLILNNKEYATLWYYRDKGSSFGQLPLAKELLYLELHSANIKDFKSIEKFPKLKRLEIHYCVKLESDKGLKVLNKTIEHLHINQSKNLQLTGEISHLKKLRVLCLNACGSLENLNFLKDLPNLVDFRFVNTNVLNGDLTPILDHPNLRNAGFLNKRNFNLKSENVNALLESKASGDYKEFAYKGDYETFKYK